MKNQKGFFLILITIIAMITGCDSTPTTIIDGGGTVSDIDFSVLEFSSDISVMTPYDYNLSSLRSVGMVAPASAKSNGNTSLLSYSNNGFEGFKPIVAKNEDNQKFIFTNVNLEDIGDNYYLGYADICLISQDPVVSQNKEGEDENGNSIISSSDVYVDIESFLGNYPLIIDLDNAQIHLLRNPSTGKGLSIDMYSEYNENRSGYTTPNAIYLIASPYDINGWIGSNEQIYRISKKDLASGNGSLVAITNIQNTNSYYSIEIISCSDSAVVGYYGSEPRYFLVDISNSRPLTLLDRDDYIFDIPEIDATNQSMYKLNFDTLVLDGNEAHSYNLVEGKLISMNFTINNGTLIKNGYDIYNTGLGDYWSWVDSISLINNERGCETVLMLSDGYYSYTDSHRIVRVTHYDGQFAVDFIDEKIEVDSIDQFFSIPGRTYWLENVLRVPSYICYADYNNSKSIVRIPVKGLQISDWNINVSDDGTVTYLQYYNQNSIGMYNWNPDNSTSSPKLITSYEGDVSQVFTINV